MKTGKRSKLWPNILSKCIGYNDLLQKKFQNADNKQRELMIWGKVILFVLERKKSVH